MVGVCGGGGLFTSWGLGNRERQRERKRERERRRRARDPISLQGHIPSALTSSH
jgi:hypothetical protein